MSDRRGRLFTDLWLQEKLLPQDAVLPKLIRNLDTFRIRSSYCDLNCRTGVSDRPGHLFTNLWLQEETLPQPFVQNEPPPNFWRRDCLPLYLPICGLHYKNYLIRVFAIVESQAGLTNPMFAISESRYPFVNNLWAFYYLLVTQV